MRPPFAFAVGFGLLSTLAALGAGPSRGNAGGVASTVHNLSVSSPGEVHSLTETEVCKFCHVPHNAVENQPLWGHKLSVVSTYKTSTVGRSVDGGSAAPQPDGASRLCLSCHDGTVAIVDSGARKSGPGTPSLPPLRAGSRGYIGTDLSGSHPVSIPIPDVIQPDSSVDMGLRPAASIARDPTVRLDGNGKLQCTTCHDPHDDSNYNGGRVPHFWVRSSVNEVCLSCHELR